MNLIDQKGKARIPQERDSCLDGLYLIPGRGNYFLIASALGPTQPLIQFVPGDLFLSVKRPDHEANSFLPTSAKVKMCGAIHPFHHTSSWSTVINSTTVSPLNLLLYYYYYLTIAIIIALFQ
jgi:hypothetical protein